MAMGRKATGEAIIRLAGSHRCGGVLRMAGADDVVGPASDEAGRNETATNAIHMQKTSNLADGVFNLVPPVSQS